MKNYMGEVAKLLGVELGEEFGLFGFRSRYRLEKVGLYIRDPQNDTSNGKLLGDTELTNILTGNYEIVKLPWKPKYLQTYYYVAVDGKIQSRAWLDNTSDIIFYAYGDCFPTKSEAETHAPEILKKMKEVLEICD